ncbi:MAG: cache domain-containing protein [Candidatus Thorarchaeota archaeon]|nr:cache domain-containing protein [Candidatus Thorarchaeota archaeon]
MAVTQKKGSFRRNVIATFLVISVISLGVTGFISLQFVDLIGGFTTAQSSDALATQIERNIKIAAEQNADVIQQKLESAEGLVKAIAEECESLFDSASTYLPRANIYYDYFFEYGAAGTYPADTHYEERYGINVSWNYSSWYAPETDSSDYMTYYAANQDAIERVSNLDFMFQYAHLQLPEFRWLYVGFENDLWINYPGSDVGGSDTDRAAEPWFPTGDEFYQEIRAGSGSMVFYGPYLDPIDNVLLMSIGRAVYDDSDTLLGIVAGDISIESIRTKILDVQVLETGYAALITESGDILAHPDVDDEVYERYDTQFARLPTLQEFEVDGTTSALTPVEINQILAGTTGIIEFSKDNEDYILAHTPVGVGGYICIIIVPVDEVQAAIPLLEANIQAANLQATTFILMITAAGILIAGAVAILVANQITGPLQYLMELATRNVSAMIRKDSLDTTDLQVDASYMDKDDEIGELARAFQGMLDSIKEDESE